MRTQAQRHSGFTLIELLMVIAIAAIIFTLSIAGFRSYAGYQQYNQAVSDVNFVLQQTRLSARSAEADAAHGVKILNGSITYFVGDTYTLGAPTNEVIDYQLVTLVPNFTGGVDEIIFDKLTGLPSATGTITVTGVAYTEATTLTISDTGVIQ